MIGGYPMSGDSNQILKNALGLPAIERAKIVDRLLSSLDQPDREIDALWRKEVEDRLKAYQQGKIKAVPLKEVLSRYLDEN